MMNDAPIPQGQCGHSECTNLVRPGTTYCSLSCSDSVQPPGAAPRRREEYEANPKANADAFYDGWFRTGDQGIMDADGYVSIVGRLKEIINRGGEKISPREVDEIIMEHPAVHQCVTFSLPHEMLGEDVAAAVVLKQGAEASDKELRQFAASKLADFKVPRKILILKEIPVGATGKLQRIGLAQKLGLA